MFRAQNLQDCSNCAKNRAPDSSWVVIDDRIEFSRKVQVSHLELFNHGLENRCPLFSIFSGGYHLSISHCFWQGCMKHRDALGTNTENNAMESNSELYR